MKDIIRLLQDYQEFKDKNNSEDFHVFGEWLRQKHAPTRDYTTNDEEVNEAGLDVMITYLLGNLTGYTEAWIKLAYQELPLLSIGDFSILKTVEHYQNPSKKEVAYEVVMERSTCIESIKRLIKEGLLAEAIDPNDRRIRRVHLTKGGKELMPLLNQRMTNLGSLLVGNLSEVEKKSLLPTLNKLLRFHENLYRNMKKEAIKKNYKL